MKATAALTIGSFVATVAAYLFQIAGARVLGAEAFAPVTVLWTLQFIVMHVLYVPIEEYAIREQRLGRSVDHSLIATCVAIATAASVLFVLLTREQLFNGHTGYGWAAAAIVVSYAIFALTRARLAAEGRYTTYGLVTASEGLLRLVAGIALLIASASAYGFGWALAIAPLAALAWFVKPSREGPSSHGARLLLPIIGAGAFSQLLIGAAPVVVGLLGAPASTISVVFVTFALLRSPLWVLRGLLARALPAFTDQLQAGKHLQVVALSRRVMFAATLGAVLAAIAGTTLGPTVIATMFGGEFRPSGAFAGIVSAGVILAGAGLLANQVLIAFGRTNAIQVAWFAGLVTAICLLAINADVSIRVALAFTGGQATAVAVLALSIERHLRSGPAAPGPTLAVPVGTERS